MKPTAYHPPTQRHLSGMTTTAARPVAAPPAEDTDPLRPARGILLGLAGGAAIWAVIIGGVIRFFA